jgi:hypothetical protein
VGGASHRIRDEFGVLTPDAVRIDIAAVVGNRAGWLSG